MLNDRSTIRDFLATRRSAKPRDLTGPGPVGDELDAILELAARTPDHGQLVPFRFLVIGEDQREALGELWMRALTTEDPDAPSAKVEKAQAFARYGGTLVVLLAAPIPGHKIPMWDQELTVGAAGMNLLHAANAHGYVAGWVTGWAATSATIAEALCDPGERIAGFVFIGQPGHELAERLRPAAADVRRDWDNISKF